MLNNCFRLQIDVYKLRHEGDLNKQAIKTDNN